MKTKCNWIFGAILTFVVLGCVHTTPPRPLSEGAQYKEFRNIGLKMILPRQSPWFDDLGDDTLLVGLLRQQYKVFIPTGISDEEFNIFISIDRLTPEKYAKKIIYPNNVEPKDYGEWVNRKHETLSEFRHGTYGLSFMLDKKCPNGDVLWICARIYTKDVSDDDIVTIRHFINSVEPLR